MTSDPGGRPATELARRMIDAGDAPPQTLSGEECVALAWELKQLCYAAWTSEPQRAAKASEALRRLCSAHGTGLVAARQACEIDALAEWTAGIACLTGGQMAEATERFDRAAELFRDLGQPHHAAETQVPKIMALSMLGQHALAAACAEQTQHEFVAQGDVRAAGKVSLNLGSLHLRRDAFRDSARHYREAAVLFARVGDREHSVMADIGMGDALTALGDFDEAMRIYARARMRAATHALPVMEAMVEESVALLELSRGRYTEALAGLEGSRRGYERLAMPQHLAIAEKQLADAYLELRLLPEALALFDQALSKFCALDMPDDEAWTLAQRGRAQVLSEDPEAAADSLFRAAAAFARQDNGVGTAAVALARAELALHTDDADAALALAESAEQGFADADLPERRARADVIRARALLAAGRVDEARVLFDATLQRSRQLQLLAVEAGCLTGQGSAASAVGDAAAARIAFGAAIESYEVQRSALPGDEIRSAFLAESLRPYQELLRMVLDDDARSPSCELAAEVLRQADRLRARTLGERLAGGVDAEGDAGADTADLRARLNWLYRRVHRLQDEATPSAALTTELRSTERELLERARRQRLVAGGRQASVVPGQRGSSGDALDVEALRDSLADGDALVEYGVVDDELFACVVTPTGVALQRHVARWPDVLEAVRAARFQIETLRHGAAPVSRHLAILTGRAQARMRRLHELIWAPLSQALARSRRVTIVPYAQLGSLPFAALHDGEHALVERYGLTFAPSARVALRGLRTHPAPPRQALVVGESTRLPHAAEEARVVAGLFPQARAFVGEQATLDALHANAGDADVIHLACHAQFRSDNPMFSALHLADGALTVESAEALSLKPCTVVLSACETGLAQMGKGDEMVGLVRAFLVAGAARVLASLWPVDDEITGVFMAHFHRALRRGVAPATALGFAQIEVMREHPHPFYWAAFHLYGRW